jgi:superfamily II DNA or RNA helicase
MELPDSISDYLKAYSAELSDQILKSFPPLYSPEETPSPVLTELYRKPFKAQEVAVMSSVRRLERARTAAIIGEMGTGKTFMAMSAVHCEAAGRPYACLVMAPGTLLEKWSREVLATIPGARVYIIDSLRSQRPGIAGHQGVNEVRLRRGRIVRDGVHTTLTEMRLRRNHRSAWDRWIAERGKTAHFFIVGRDKGKLGWFWRHSFNVARCGPYCGAVVNPDSGLPVVIDEDHRLLRSDFERKERFSEILNSARHPLYSPLWQADETKIRRCAPIEFIGRFLPSFFRYGIADEVHEAKAVDTAQGNALGKLAAAVEKLIVLTGTLTGGVASDIFHILFRIDASRMIAEGYEYGDAGLRAFSQTYGVLETITTIEAEDNACSKARITRQMKQKPGASPLLFGRFLMDLAAFVSLEDISDQLPPYTEDVVTVPMDEALAKAYKELERDITDALRDHRGNPSVASTALNALLLYPDRPWKIGPLYGSEYDPETRRRDRFLIADPADLDESVLYAKERKLIEIVQSELANSRGVQIYATYTQKRDVTRRLQEILQKAGVRSAILTTDTPPEQREAWYERQLTAGVRVFIAHPRLIQVGLDLLCCPAMVWYQTGYSTFTLRQASRRSWRIGQRQPVSVRFLCYDQTAQVGCLRLMGKKLLVSMALEGKFVDSELQSLDEGDDVLTSLARELVMNRGVGESADVVWRELRAQSVITCRTPAPEPVAEPRCANESSLASKSELVFGQTMTAIRKRAAAQIPAEQLPLF